MKFHRSDIAKAMVLSIVAAGALTVAVGAHANGVNWSVGINLPGIYVGAPEPPFYYAPAPLYAPPAPVYYQPAAPIYDRPPPRVYYRRAPVAYDSPPDYYGPAPGYWNPRRRHHHHYHDRDGNNQD